MYSRKSSLAIGFLFCATVAQASVFDGGEFNASKVSDKTEFGFYGPDLAPTEKNPPKEDRFAAAPVGKPLYVVGDDNKCYWSNFSYSNHEKVMIVYYKSPVSNEHCVYQKQFNLTPVGYSISVKNGGVCVPTFADLQGIHQNWSIKETGAPVPFSNCVGNESYGDNKDKDKDVDLRAQAEREPPAEAKSVTVDEIKGVAARLPASSTPLAAPVAPVAVTLPAPTVVEAVPAPGPAPAPVALAIAAPLSKGEKVKDVKYDGKRFTVQLLSFTHSSQAKNAIAALAEKGVKAFEVEGIVDGTRRFRVCAGLYLTAREAVKAKKGLAKKAESSDSFVQNLSAYKIGHLGKFGHRDTASTAK